MPDKFGQEVRSKIMSQIKGRDTSPERLVRSFLHHRGFRFRIHIKSLPGRPDIVLRKYRTVVFVHGCFWHQHPGCRYSHIPKSNRAYWKPKLERNVRRDIQCEEQLRNLGWKVAILWECEINDAYLSAFAETLKNVT